jgi:hypothetical protein
VLARPVIEFRQLGLEPGPEAWRHEGIERGARDIDQISLGESLPETCPYTFDQILNEDSWPVWADESVARDQC